MKNNLFPIAKEGWKSIGISIVSLIFFYIFDLELLTFFAFIAVVLFIFIYRNPEREASPFESDSVVSPVDGIVLSMEEITSSEYAYKITINSNYLNVSVLRAPLNSFVQSLVSVKGARLSETNNLMKKINSKTEIIFEDYKKNKLKVIHTLKRSLNEVQIAIKKDEKINQGIRYGVAVNGITTLYLPRNFRLNITVGNELKASQTLIGYFSE